MNNFVIFSTIFLLLNMKSCTCDCNTQEFNSRSFVIGPYNLNQNSLTVKANSTVLATCSQIDNCFNALGITLNSITVTYLTLIIDNATISNYQNVRLIYENGNSPTVICTAMQIYTRPRNITCNTDIGNGNILITCLASQVSTPITCSSFSFPPLNPAHVTYVQKNAEVDSVYYDYECILTYRLALLGPGNHTFTIDVICNLSDTNTYSYCGSNYTRTQLVFPEVEISSPCPNGADVINNLTMAGSVATCTCNLKSSGYPPGYASWSSPTNGPLSLTTVDNRVILNLNYDNKSQNHTYTCHANSDLGPNYQEQYFVARFAYGPSNVIISIDPNKNEFDMCPGINVNLIVTCVVPDSSVYPALNMELNIDNMTMLATSSYLRQLYHFNTSGSYEFRCHAENSVFKKLNKDSAIIVTIREPPKTPPVLMVNHTKQYIGMARNTINVSTDEIVSVTCNVTGGFPPVDSTNITCDDHAVMLVVDGQVKVRLSTEGQVVICNCTAYHVSGCYTNNTSSLRLSAIAPVKSINDSKLTIGLAVGLSVAGFIVIIVIIICVTKRSRPSSHPPQPYQRRAGYDSTTVLTPDENTNYNPVIIQGSALNPIVAESSYSEISLDANDSNNNSERSRIARPDSKERVFVEHVGSETRITLENYNGRWKFLRSKITKRSQYLTQSKPQAPGANRQGKAEVPRSMRGTVSKSLKPKVRKGGYVNTNELGATLGKPNEIEEAVPDKYIQDHLKRDEMKKDDGNPKGAFKISQTDLNGGETDRKQTGKRRYENVYKEM